MKLSVCMITKNRAHKIVDAINSIHGVADEVVVVDTGSADNTLEVCGKFEKVKLYHFEWIKDFSAARNFSIGKATGDWVFVLDSDEIVINPESIKAAISDEYDAYYVNLRYGAMTQLTYRMWRKDSGIIYVCPVHEVPTEPKDINRLCVKTDILIEHKKDPAEKEETTARNVEILTAWDKKHPHDCRTLFYLAYALKESGEFDKAVGVFERYIFLESKQEYPYVEQAYIAQLNVGYIHEFQGYLGMAEQDYKNAIDILRTRREAHFQLGKMFFEAGKFTECLSYMKRCYESPIPTDVRMWIELTQYRELPLRYMVMCYEETKNFDVALKYCQIGIDQKYDNNFFIPREQYIKRLQGNAKKYIIEVNRAGALGDVLMSTAVCKAIKDANPGCILRFVTHINSAPILLNNPYIDEIATRGYPDAKKKIYLTYPEEVGSGKLSGHLIDRFAACAKLKNVYKVPSLHLNLRDMVLYDSYIDSAKDAPLCKPYVTIHTTAGWSPYKNWPVDFWNELSVKIKLFGQNVIQIGHESDLKCENSIDYRGKDIRQQFGLLSKSMLHIGIDSVYMHAAKALGVKSVIMWGSTSPENYGYEDNTNIYYGFDCQPCNRNYAWAPRYIDDCPNNAKCMSSITPDAVSEFVENIITI